MKTYLSTLMVVVAMLGVPAFAQDETKPSADVQAVVQGGNEFGFDLYGRLAQSQKGNLFISPASIHTALAMTYAGARGKTAEEMAKTLHFSLDAAKLNAAFGQLVKGLNSPYKMGDTVAYQLVVANALWGRKGYSFEKDFLDLLKTDYDADLNEVDFSKPVEAAKIINDWVEKQTRDKIKDLIPAIAINPDLTRLVLTNAVYFKSNWADKFTKEWTRDEEFKLSADKTVKVPMMNQQHHFGYAENDLLQAVELPYMAHDLSMVILLPKKVDGLAELEKSLTFKNVSEWLKAVKPVDVRVTIPKFKFPAEFSLGDVLKAMGMPLAFSSDADFSGMTKAEKLAISAVLHKAFVAVDEDGTEAAAATAVIVAAESEQELAPPKVFKADHPFVFLIRHNATGEILFLGRVANPKGE